MSVDYVLNCPCCTGGGPPGQPCGCPIVPVNLKIVLLSISIVGGPSPSAGCTIAPTTGCPNTFLTDAFPIGVFVPLTYYPTDPGGVNWGNPGWYTPLLTYSRGSIPGCGADPTIESINLVCSNLASGSCCGGGTDLTILPGGKVHPNSYTVQSGDVGNVIYTFDSMGNPFRQYTITAVDTVANTWTLSSTYDTGGVTWKVYQYNLNVENASAETQYSRDETTCGSIPSEFELQFTTGLSITCNDTTLRAHWKIVAA